MSEFIIGTTNLEKPTKGKTNYARLQEGDNLFRILPPMHSLAKAGKYFQYWRIHWGFRASGGGARPVICIENKDFKSGIIKEHCPACDMVYEFKKEYEMLKKMHETNPAKISKDQLNDFYTKKIVAFDGDGKYFVNAVDATGKIVVLALPKTAKMAFEARVERLRKEEGIDPTGTNGIYLNFVRSGKGRDTKYSVEPQLISVPGSPGAKQYKFQVLDTEFVERLKRESTDLSKLYTPISAEDMSAIVNASEEERPKIVDRVFSRGTTDKQESQVQGLQSLGNGAVGTVKVEVTPDLSVKAVTPEKPKTVDSGFNNPVSDISGMDDADFEAFMSRHHGE